jgi:uncharacterized membrane protein
MKELFPWERAQDAAHTTNVSLLSLYLTIVVKEFWKIFLRDQTKTFVDIIPFIPFLSTMTVASIWTGLLLASR